MKDGNIGKCLSINQINAKIRNNNFYIKYLQQTFTSFSYIVRKC